MEMIFQITKFLTIEDIGKLALSSKKMAHIIWSLYIPSVHGRRVLAQKIISEIKPGYSYSTLKDDIRNAAAMIPAPSNAPGSVRNICLPPHIDLVFCKLYAEAGKFLKRLTILYPPSKRIELLFAFLEGFNDLGYKITPESLFSKESSIQTRALMRAQGKLVHNFIEGWEE